MLALSLSAALLLALLCACGSAGDPETTIIPPDPTESASVSPADPTQKPTQAPPSAEPSEEPTEGPQSTNSPTHHPEETHHAEPTHHPEETHHVSPTSTPKPTPAPTPKPTPAPTPKPTPAPTPAPTPEPTAEPSQSAGADLTSFYQTVLNSYGFPAMGTPPDDFVANFYPGLTGISTVQRVVGTPMMTGVAAELTLVQVSNSSDVSAVKSILQARVDSQVAGGAFYPMVVEAWQNNSRIVSNGDYVMLVVHDSCDSIVAQFNALF